MRRRHLRLPSSSDEDDDAPQPQILNPPNPHPNPPLEISDDDFVDVPDDLSPPSPRFAETPPENRREAAPPAAVAMEEERTGPVWPIDEFLRGLGLRLRREWLESCTAGLMAAGSGFEGLGVSGKAKKCFEQFLFSDMNCSGAGVLPENVHRMHKTELEGPFVLQVDEIVNISAPLRERYHDAPAGCKRCLKLSMTDGVQRVFGMEYRPIKELEVLASSGLKVVICNVDIRRGLLMLVPEVFTVLGGLANDLDVARKRLVAEVNKPPRGKRKHGNICSLTTRASLAAWPSDTISLGAQTDSTPQNPSEHQILDQVANLASSGAVTRGTTIEEVVDPNVGRNNTEEFAAQSARTTAAEESSGHTEANIFKESVRDNNIPDAEPNLVHSVSDLDMPDAEPNLVHSASDMDVVHASDVEGAIGEVEHPQILSGDNEIPFTYLACLIAKWTMQNDSKTGIQGRIKCFLTGVKGFQFKQRTSYELHVYVDDGSLISEVLIDHNVVQKGIGHCPEEVTAALSSTEKKTVADMKETMKKFQLFLANFEGTMLLEMNRNSSLPVVLEMNQGISTSDPWLLLRRLEKTVSQSSQQNNLNPIDLSP